MSEISQPALHILGWTCGIPYFTKSAASKPNPWPDPTPGLCWRRDSPGEAGLTATHGGSPSKGRALASEVLFDLKMKEGVRELFLFYFIKKSPSISPSPFIFSVKG